MFLSGEPQTIHAEGNRSKQSPQATALCSDCGPDPLKDAKTSEECSTERFTQIHILSTITFRVVIEMVPLLAC